jgi:site-specific DNA-methyltransferase (adenine-specific)
MKTLEEKSVDMVLTSPPYDNLRTYKGYTFNFEGIAKEIYRVLKDGGVCVWVVGDATIKGSETGTSFKQALYFKEIGFNLHDTMIYRKVNPVPLTHNRYEQEFEYMFVFSKGVPKTFNPIKEPCKYAGQKRNRKYTLTSREYSNEIMRLRDEDEQTKSEKICGNIFEYQVGLKYGIANKHSAIFPEKLAEDHILSWSNEGDIILDPMAGSGTTLKMAKKNNRNYIGIEISPEYIEIINKRLANLQ